MKFTLINNPVRNIIKDIYYKYFFYKIPIKWGKNYLEAKLKNGFNIKLVYSKAFDKKFYASRYYSQELISILRESNAYFRYYFPKIGDIVIDAGAYEGGITILLSKLVGENGRVIAFEPCKNIIGTLRKNLSINGVENVTIIESGLWNKDTNLYFKEGDVGSGICRKEESDYMIEVKKLDSVIKKLNIPKDKVRFIKMDIEGAEIEAVEGSVDLIKNGTPSFAIASYHVIDGEKTYKKLRGLFKKLNYSVIVGYPYHLTTWAKKKTGS